MIDITIHEGEQKDLLQRFEGEQWPLADRLHYGDRIPDLSIKKYTILAQEGDKIIGYIYLETDMGVAAINSLLVHNDFQRKGVASELMQNAEEKAKTEGCHLLKVETGKEWGAKQFYESQGFATTANLKEYYDKRDFVLMEKRI